MLHGLRSGWLTNISWGTLNKGVFSGVVQELILALRLFCTFINHLGMNMKSPLINVVARTKIGSVANNKMARAILWSRLDCLVSWGLAK